MPQGIYNLDWFAHNETIKYPIDSESSFIPDGYNTIPSGLMGVITDISLCSNRKVIAYITSLTVTDKMVTIVIALTDESDTPRTSYLIFSDIQANITPNRYYTLTPKGRLGCYGVICFGSGVKDHFCSYKFSSPEQATFLPSTINVFQYPVLRIESGGGTYRPYGDIKFKVSSNIVANIEEIRPQHGEDGEPLDSVKAITFSLNTDLGIEELEKYLSICDARPENYSFPDKGIQSIGGATPDEDGNVNIVFDNIYANSDSTGITLLSTDYELDDICGEDKPPLTGEDECPYSPYIQDDPEDTEEPVVISSCDSPVAPISFKRDVYGTGITIDNKGITTTEEYNSTIKLNIPKLTNIRYCSVSVEYNPDDFRIDTDGYVSITAYCDKGNKNFTIQPILHEIRSNCLPSMGIYQKVNMRDEYNDREYGKATITFDACSNLITLNIEGVENYTIAGELSEELDTIGLSIRGKVYITDIQYK